MRIITFLFSVFAFSSLLYPQSGLPSSRERTASVRQSAPISAQSLLGSANVPEGLSAAENSGSGTPVTLAAYYPGSFFFESFENDIFPPSGWQTINVEGDMEWMRYNSYYITGSYSAYLQYESSYSEKGIDWLITPRLTAYSGDSLIFYVHPQDNFYPPDTLRVLISFDESISYDPDVSFTNTLVVIPVDTLDGKWYKYSFPMDAYIGKQFYVGFKEVNENGCGVFIEDVSLGQQKDNDISVDYIASFPLLEKDQSITPKASFQNLGKTTQTFDVVMEIPSTGYISRKTCSSVASLATVSVSFDAWSSNVEGTHDVRVYAEFTGDEDLNNNELTGKYKIIKDMTWTAWHLETAMPSNRAAHGEISYGPNRDVADTSFIYILGGNGGANFDYIYKYNSVSYKWSQVKQLPEKLNGFQSVEVNGKIYIPGGKNPNYLTPKLYIYDIKTNSFTTGADIPYPVTLYTIGVYKDRYIYLFGGIKDLSATVSSQAPTNVQIYDISANTWGSGTPLPKAGGAAMAGSIIQNKIVLTGSVTDTYPSNITYYGEIDTTNPYNIKWKTGTHPGGGVAYAAGGALYDKDKKYVFISGGTTQSGLTTATWAYNLNEQEWERAPNKISACYIPSSLEPVVRNDSVYMVTTGGIGSGWLNVNEWLYVGSNNPLEKVDAASVSVDFDTVIVNEAYTPKATYTNVGSTTGKVFVKMEINPGGYVSVDSIDALAYNAYEQISFPEWTPTSVGTYAVKIYAANAEDYNLKNDTLTSYITVKNPPIDVASVSVDFDTVFLNTAHTPKATFANLEHLSQSVIVTMEINPGNYKSVYTIPSLAYNVNEQVSFASWTPVNTGTYAVKIYTSLPGDENLSNDTVTSQVIVRKIGIDAASFSIDFDSVLVNSAYIPMATFINKDKLTQTFKTTMEITPGGYVSVDTVVSLPYNVKKQVSFGLWVPTSVGTYTVRIYTSLVGDEDLINDTLTTQVVVYEIAKDAASVSIDFDTVLVNASHIPKATFANLEQVPQDVIVTMEINPGNYKSADTIPSLTYNVNRQVSFDSWIPASAGAYAVKIYTSLAGDDNLSNDTLVSRVIVKNPRMDVASVSIDFDTVLVNTPYVPKATFANLEQVPQDVIVTMEINPGNYKSIDTISSLTYNVNRQASFAAWTPSNTGTYSVKTYIYLAGDDDPDNDTLVSTVVVKNLGIDVAAFSIDFDTVVVNTEFIPKATFTNKQVDAKDVIVTLEITPGGYVSVDTIASIGYEDKEQVSFKSWTPDSIGVYIVKAYTYLAGDEDLSNDTVSSQVVVKKIAMDAASISIDFDTVLVNTAYIPKATFGNLEQIPQDVIVAMEINPENYKSVDTIASLIYNTNKQVSFKSWTPASAGIYEVKIYTSLPGDEDLSNDTLIANVIVRNPGVDVAAFSIDFDTVVVNKKFVPTVTFTNKQAAAQNVIVTLEVPSRYMSIDTIPHIEHGEKIKAFFGEWIPDSIGTYMVRAYSYISEDENLSNDTLTAWIVVRGSKIDAAPVSVNFDTVIVNRKFVPKATFENRGIAARNIIASMEINSQDYKSVDTISLLTDNARRQLSFSAWTPDSVGLYAVKIFTSLSGDEETGNDTLISPVVVRNIEKDVASFSIDFDTIIVRRTFVPKATFTNNQPVPRTFTVTMRISPSGYIRSDTIKSLSYNEKKQVSFYPWVPDSSQTYNIKIYASLAGDEDLTNDTLTSQAVVKNIERDVAPVSVDFDTVLINKSFIPKATFINKQAKTQTFITTMMITPGNYISVDTVKALTYKEKRQAAFGSWTPDSAGKYSVKVYTSLMRDEDLSNDTLKTYAAVVKPIVPAEYLLSQNYPNPFNPSTTIRYGVPQAGFVELKIYNILGQEVITLVKEEKEAGIYEVKFNASGMGLASGIYLYRLKAGDFVKAKKLMLIK